MFLHCCYHIFSGPVSFVSSYCTLASSWWRLDFNNKFTGTLLVPRIPKNVELKILEWKPSTISLDLINTKYEQNNVNK